MPEDIQLSDSDGVFLVNAARIAVTGFLSNGNRLKYATSGDISGDKSSVVGYASIIFVDKLALVKKISTCYNI
jgi:AmmeMemoRadiSam system protein B